jgi:hypothetical protein
MNARKELSSRLSQQWKKVMKSHPQESEQIPTEL